MAIIINYYFIGPYLYTVLVNGDYWVSVVLHFDSPIAGSFNDYHIADGNGICGKSSIPNVYTIRGYDNSIGF